MGDSFEGLDPVLAVVGTGDISSGDTFDLTGAQAADKASKEQAAQNASERAFKKAAADQARADLFRLFPAAQQDLSAGQQAAFDVFGQTVPQQFSTFQQGNIGAQQALLAGLPQQRNAILGLPTDFSGFQPQTIGFDSSFSQGHQVPGFQGGAQQTGPPPAVLPSVETGGVDFASQIAGLEAQLAEAQAINQAAAKSEEIASVVGSSLPRRGALSASALARRKGR